MCLLHVSATLNPILQKYYLCTYIYMGLRFVLSMGIWIFHSIRNLVESNDSQNIEVYYTSFVIFICLDVYFKNSDFYSINSAVNFQFTQIHKYISYIISHCNPLVRITTQLLTSPMLRTLIFYLSGRSYHQFRQTNS